MTAKQKIQSLINAANATTGKSATDLTTAVGQLVDGYGGGGGGGLPPFTDVETGTWVPASDVSGANIAFSKTHANPPVIVALCDAQNDKNTTTNTNIEFEVIDLDSLLGASMMYSSSYSLPATIYCRYRGTSTSSTSGSAPVNIRYGRSNTGSSGNTYYRYWVNTSSFYAYTSSTSRYWRKGRKYNWIALWID